METLAVKSSNDMVDGSEIWRTSWGICIYDMICISIWCITNPINHGIFTIPTGAPRIVKPSTVLQGVNKKKNYFSSRHAENRGVVSTKKNQTQKMTHGIMALEKSNRRKLTIRETHRFLLKQYHWGTSPRIETFFRKVHVHMIFFSPLKKNCHPIWLKFISNNKTPYTEVSFLCQKISWKSATVSGKGDEAAASFQPSWFQVTLW